MNGFMIKNLPDRACLEQVAARYPEMDPEATEAHLHFLRLGAKVGERIADYLSRHGLSSGRLSILMMLNASPEEARTPGELADRCGVTAATMSRLVEALIKEGYLERVPDPGNRRVSPVRMTGTGRTHLEHLLPGYFSGVTDIFSPLSSTERQTFLNLLTKLQDHLNETDELS